jgi:hypothetical protein
MLKHIDEAREYLRLNSPQADVNKFISDALSGKPIHPKNALLMAMLLDKVLKESQEARSVANLPKTKGTRLDLHRIDVNSEAFNIVYRWKTQDLRVTEAAGLLAEVLQVDESTAKRYLPKIAKQYSLIWHALGV